MLPPLQNIDCRKNFVKQKKKITSFLFFMSRGGDIHPLWKIKRMHRGGISPPNPNKWGGYHPLTHIRGWISPPRRGGYPPPFRELLRRWYWFSTVLLVNLSSFFFLVQKHSGICPLSYSKSVGNISCRKWTSMPWWERNWLETRSWWGCLSPPHPWIWPWASHHQLQHQSTCKTKVSIFLLSRRTQDPRRQVRRDRWPWWDQEWNAPDVILLENRERRWTRMLKGNIRPSLSAKYATLSRGLKLCEDATWRATTKGR